MNIFKIVIINKRHTNSYKFTTYFKNINIIHYEIFLLFNLKITIQKGASPEHKFVKL